MTVLSASRNGRPDTSAADSSTAPPADIPADEIATTKDLEDELFALRDRFPFQMHIRGWKRSGKTTLATATDDVVCARVPAGTNRSDTLLRQSLGIIRGDGAASTPHVGGGPDMLEKVERLIYPYEAANPLIVSFPHDPLGGLDTRRAIDMYADPRIMLVPVVWAPRTNATAARNVFFPLAGDLQDRGAEGADPRTVLPAAFKIAFNEFDADAMASYGADGMDELLADEELARSRIRVSTRRGPLARLSFDGLGQKSRRYEEVLVELTTKVARTADKKGNNSYREILQAIGEPLLYISGWDLVVQYDALYRQPTLPDDIFRKFIGARLARTSKNLFLQGNVTGRIKPALGKVYVLDTAKDGAEAVLTVFEERVDRHGDVTAEAELVEPPPPVASAAPEPVATSKEEDKCFAGDELREAAFHSLGIVPAVFVGAVVLWMLGTASGPWALSVIAMLAAVIAIGYMWVRLRSRHFPGSWTYLSDGTVILRKPVNRTRNAVSRELVVKASPIERLLDTGRCFPAKNDVRPWRVFRLSRLLDGAGMSVTRRWWPGLGVVAAAGLVVQFVVRLLIG